MIDANHFTVIVRGAVDCIRYYNTSTSLIALRH